jgi:lipopolysaccharide export system permease protein
LGPPLGQYAYKMKARAIAVDVNILGAQGFWAKRDNMFLNVKQIKPGNMLEDVYIYNINKEWRLVSFIYAKEAIIKSHKKWVLRTATEKFITDEGIKIKNYSELEWKPFLTKNQSDLLYIPVSTLPLTELYSIIKAQKKGGENFRYNLTIFWQKCALPLSVIAMILVCLPFFVNRLPMRAEIGIEIAVSLVLGAVFYLFKYIIGYIVLLYDLDPFTLLMGPIVILLFIDMWLMQRATKVW